MKYAVLQYSDGNFTVPKEGYADNPDGAKQAFYSQCNALYGDKNLKHAVVKLVDENLDVVEAKYIEVIKHEAE